MWWRLALASWWRLALACDGVLSSKLMTSHSIKMMTSHSSKVMSCCDWITPNLVPSISRHSLAHVKGKDRILTSVRAAVMYGEFWILQVYVQRGCNENTGTKFALLLKLLLPSWCAASYRWDPGPQDLLSQSSQAFCASRADTRRWMLARTRGLRLLLFGLAVPPPAKSCWITNAITVHFHQVQTPIVVALNHLC